MNRSLFCLFFSTVLLVTGNLSAQITFFTIPDGNVTALKNALNSSNTDGRNDVIILATNGTYTLTAIDNGANGLPVIASDNNHSVTIEGDGATIHASGATFRVLDIASGANVVIDDLTITGGAAFGDAISPAKGGGIRSSGTLTLSGCRLTGNQANFGGGIGNGGTLVISQCVFSNNSAFNNSGAAGGGAISNQGPLTLSGSLFDSNSGASGGAIQNGSVAGVSNCTFYNNSSTTSAPQAATGGAIDNKATSTVTNCTFNANVNASGFAGGGIYNEGASAMVVNDIFKASNIVNAAGAFTSQGHNISDDSGGGLLTGSGDLTNTNPQFLSDTPQDYGGPTKTIAIGVFGSSPAIDHADPGYAPRRDQRGYFRTGAPDTGAYEYQGSVIGRVTAITRTGGSNDVSVSFEAVDRLTYRLQRKLNMTDSNWQDISGVQDLTATGNDIELIIAPGDITLGKAFYHVTFVSGP